MNERQDEQNAKPAAAVKPEEGLELLKAFLMIKDPRLRAEIVSTVKKTACGQKWREVLSRASVLSGRRFRSL